MARQKKILIFSVILVGVGVLGFGWLSRVWIHDFVFEWQKEIMLPKAQRIENPTAGLPKEPTQKASADNQKKLTQEINFDVPFTSQAPFANWDEIHKEACEEASVLMVARFWQSRPIQNSQDAEDEILKIVDFENKNFGFFKDTNAAQTAKILRDYYGFKNVEIFHDITFDDIKYEVSRGFPVIVPMAGRLLGNPYYRQPGPIYHMLVVKGYTKDKVITNDPGTRRGKDFVYDIKIFMNAIHDWPGEGIDIRSGRKVMIVARPN